MKKDHQDKNIITGNEAVALAYDPAARGLPQITAKGSGELAEELIRLAVQYGIPIKYDPDLIQILSKLEIGEDIPEEIFLAVAEILAFVYWVNHDLSSDK
jgi:flagellar biosynthesis protein